MATRKRGFITRLIEGSEKSETYARESLPSNRWSLFWDIFKGRLGKLFVINLLMLIFLIPIFLILYYRTALISYLSSMQPFTQNLFAGFPGFPNITGLAESVYLESNKIYFLIPILSLIAAVGISGGCYVIRNMVWTEGIFVANDFWRGIKLNYKVISLTALFYSILLSLTVYTNSMIDLLLVTGAVSSIVLNIGKVIMVVFMILATFVALYMLTLGVTYELKFFHLVKNAFIMTIVLLPTNLFFAFIALLPLLLYFLGGFFATLSIAFLITLGFSFALLVWTNYSQWTFDKFINDRVEGAQKNRGIYEKVNKNDSAAIKQYKMQVQELAVNSLNNRPIKPINDKDIQIEELPTTFRRDDLQKLAQQKQAMVKDHEEYVDRHKNDEKFLKIKEIEEEIKRQKEEDDKSKKGKKKK